MDYGLGMWASAVFVEVMLLVMPYTSFFGLKMNGRFLFLTASAHVIFWVVLGLYCQTRVGVQWRGRISPVTSVVTG
jgi:hypothetical protein